eukprot:360748-Chlamydomonas_euryale.AAC.1
MAARAPHPVEVGAARIVLRHRDCEVQVDHSMPPAVRYKHRFARALKDVQGPGTRPARLLRARVHVREPADGFALQARLPAIKRGRGGELAGSVSLEAWTN